MMPAPGAGAYPQQYAQPGGYPQAGYGGGSICFFQKEILMFNNDNTAAE